MSQDIKRIPGPGRGPVVKDSLGRTVCIYTASADAYRTKKQDLSIANVEVEFEDTNIYFPRRT